PCITAGGSDLLHELASLKFSACDKIDGQSGCAPEAPRIELLPAQKSSYAASTSYDAPSLTGWCSIYKFPPSHTTFSQIFQPAGEAMGVPRRAASAQRKFVRSGDIGAKRSKGRPLSQEEIALEPGPRLVSWSPSMQWAIPASRFSRVMSMPNRINASI